jgi:hypothetical protein
VSRLTKSEMLMALVACICFLWVAGHWAFLSVPLTLAIVASWFIPQRYSNTPRQQRILFSIIGIPFLLLGLYNFTIGGVAGFQRIAVLGAVYVLAGGVVELYRCPEQARPAVFHAGLVTVILVGGLTRANPYYMGCLFLYTLGFVGLLNQPVSGMIGGPKKREHRAPRAVLLIGLLLAIPLANFYNSLVPGFSRVLYDSYASTLMGSQQSALLYRFSSDLSTIQDLRGSDEISCRVFGSPTLLRGQVFYNYQGGRWSGIKARDQRELLTSSVGRFSLGETGDRQGLQSWRIEPVKLFAGPLSVPAGAMEVIATVDELELDPFDGLVADNEKPFQVLATGRPGRGISPRKPSLDSDEWAQYYLQLPEDLSEPLKDIAERIVGESSPSAQFAAARISQYLTKNGRYDPGAHHSGRQPILHFLGEGQLAGHCEYFASSQTLLLRSLGIPARYVVGYNAAERNSWGDYLIVRDRDAHAWVEAYIDNEWQVYDPTPAAEREEIHPEGFKTPSLEALWDYLSHLSSGFWRWISDLEGSSLENKLLAGIGAMLLAGIVGALYRFRHSLLSWGNRRESQEPLQALGQAFFDRLSRKGLQRKLAETPLEFSRRVLQDCGPEPAKWLEDYIVLRFRGAADSQISELADRLERMTEF